MTNFENNKTELMRLLVTMPDTCIRVWQMRTGNSNFSCPSAMAGELTGDEICKACEEQNNIWLLQEVGVGGLPFDWSKVKVGDVVLGLHMETGTKCEFRVLGKERNLLWIEYEEIYKEPFLTIDGWVEKLVLREENKVVPIKLIEEKMFGFKIETHETERGDKVVSERNE